VHPGHASIPLVPIDVPHVVVIFEGRLVVAPRSPATRELSFLFAPATCFVRIGEVAVHLQFQPDGSVNLGEVSELNIFVHARAYIAAELQF